MFAATATECRARNRARGKSVPDRVLSGQLRQLSEQRPALDTEGFAALIEPATVRVAPPQIARATAQAARQVDDPVGLRFGLQLPVHTWPGGPPEARSRLLAIADAAEAAGFSSLWVMDHFRQIPMFGPAWHDMLESYTTLAFLAGVTERLRLGTLVSGITYRNVAHLGKIIATLDVLSGGRADVRARALGWFEAEHRAYGWPFPSVDERYALLEDALQLPPAAVGQGDARLLRPGAGGARGHVLPAAAPAARPDPGGRQR